MSKIKFLIKNEQNGLYWDANHKQFEELIFMATQYDTYGKAESDIELLSTEIGYLQIVKLWV